MQLYIKVQIQPQGPDFPLDIWRHIRKAVDSRQKLCVHTKTEICIGDFIQHH